MLRKRRVIYAVILVGCWYGFNAMLPDIGCRLPIRHSMILSVFRTHMLLLATGSQTFGDLGRNEAEPMRQMVYDAGYRLVNIRAQDGSVRAVIAYPRDLAILKHGWGACVLALDCDSIELPSFALLPDGRVLQNREVGYCDGNTPHSTTLGSFDERNGWHLMNRYRFDENGERVEE